MKQAAELIKYIGDQFTTVLAFDFSCRKRMAIYFLVACIIGAVAFAVSMFHPVLLIVHLIVGAGYFFSFGLPLVLISELRIRYLKQSGRNNADFYAFEVWILSFLVFLTGFYILGTLQVVVGRMNLEMLSYYYDPEKRLEAFSFYFFFKMLPVWVIDTMIPVHLLLKKRLPAPETIDPHDNAQGGYKEVTFAGGTTFMRFNPKDITHISIEEHYAKIYAVANGNIKESEIKQSLSNILKKLPEDLFVRIHRAHAVNMRHIAELSRQSDGYQIAIKNSEVVLPVSRRNLSTIREKMAKFQII